MLDLIFLGQLCEYIRSFLSTDQKRYLKNVRIHVMSYEQDGILKDN